MGHAKGHVHVGNMVWYAGLSYTIYRSEKSISKMTKS